MKRLLIMFAVAVCLFTTISRADEYYYFCVRPDDTNDLVASYCSTTQVAVLSSGGHRMSIEVTKAQYDAGFEALPIAVIEAAVTAGKAQTADTAKWTDRERRFAEVLLKEINILRDAAGLPDRTMAQLEAAMRNEP
jgi:hypothetical protein